MKIMLEEMQDHPPQCVPVQMGLLATLVAVIAKSLRAAIRTNYFFFIMMHD